MPEAKKLNAIIKSVKICKVNDLWRRKPGPLGFEDTDAIIVTAETTDGKIVKETFYTCIKADGTFDTNAFARGAKARRRKLANFLIYYKITDKIKGYNILEKVNEWKGKEVKVVSSEYGDYIFVP